MTLIHTDERDKAGCHVLIRALQSAMRLGSSANIPFISVDQR